MRIRFVVPRVGGIGGIQQFAASVLPWLGDEVQVEVESWRAPGLTGRLRSVAAQAAPARRESATGVDLSHYWHVRASLGVRESNRVITCHGSEVLRRGLPWWERPAVAAALRGSRALVANSAFTRDYLVSDYGMDSALVHVVTPGVPASPAPSIPPPDARVRIGTLARLVHRKNVPAIIDALCLVRDEHGVELVYLLAGDGPDREDILRKLKSSGLDHEYHGGITDEVKRFHFYPRLDVFLLPTLQSDSDVEGFGIVYLEANAAGVPVVASRTGGVVDAVAEGSSGLFADPADPRDMARAVVALLADRARYRDECLAWAGQHTDQRSGERLAGLYAQLVSGG